MGELSWAVVMPVKALTEAKTRLRRAPDTPVGPLVLAMAQDTVAAALACPLVAEVVVVTDDGVAGEALTALGARIVPDQPAAGLNPAVSYGAGRTGGQRGVAVMSADLPALRPPELAAALRAAAAAAPRAFVPDAAGHGTTLLAAHPGVPLDPHFGRHSAGAHAASGAHRLAGRWPSLRRDVDTEADLVAAWRLGLGRHTAAQVVRERHT